MNARARAVRQLEERIGHVIKDRELLERALTHASVGDRKPATENNQTLEFLGDRVLNLIVADELMTRIPAFQEGELTKAFHKLVNVEACAEIARALGLDQALRLGGGAGQMGMRKNTRVLGDACEALLGAIYRDGGLDPARACVLDLWGELLDKVDSPRDREPKTALNEWALGRGLGAPEYRVVGQAGPAHAPRFEVEVFVRGFEPERGEAGSKKDAEKLVADRLLRRLEAGI